MKIEFSILCILLFLNSYSQEKEIRFKYALVYNHGSRNQQVYYVPDSSNRKVVIQSWTQEGTSLNLLQNYDYMIKYNNNYYPLKIDNQRKAKISKPSSVAVSDDMQLQFNLIKKDNRKDCALGIIGNYYSVTDSLSFYTDTLHICIAEKL